MGRIKKSRFFSFLFDCLSFNGPWAISFDLFLIIVLLALIPFEWLTFSPAKCVFKNILLPFLYQGNCPTEGLFANCECPACGLTRGMSHLLDGNIDKALSYNPLSIPVFCIMVAVLALNVYRIIRRPTKIV
jgi:hypothetical protein